MEMSQLTNWRDSLLSQKDNISKQVKHVNKLILLLERSIENHDWVENQLKEIVEGEK